MGVMGMNEHEKSRHMQLQEVSQQEFCDHIEEDDFFLAYGNPLIINCENGFRLLAVAWPLAERMLRMAGRGEEADEVIKRCAEMQGEEDKGIHEDDKDDPRIKYWMYEFEMPETVKAEIDACCKRYELTREELFETMVTYYANLAKNDPERLKKVRDEVCALKGEDCEIHLVRNYPVYKGETEALALKRKLAEEKTEERMQKK